MKFLIEKRFIFQQPPQAQELQQAQTPVVETGKIAPTSNLDTNKDIVQNSADKIGAEEKAKGGNTVTRANELLANLENLPVGSTEIKRIG